MHATEGFKGSESLKFGRTRNGATDFVAATIDGGLIPLGITASRGAYGRGVLVYVGTDGILQGVPFDQRRLRTKGEAMPLEHAPISTGSPRFDLSATGQPVPPHTMPPWVS